MAEITTQDVRAFLSKIQGQRITLKDLRTEFNILPGDKSFDAIRYIMSELAKQKVVKPNVRGEYKVITQVKPVKVFGMNRELHAPFDLRFPRDFETMMEMLFADCIVLREHDVITIGGQSNFGKTTLAINFLGENIHHRPVIMGNEFTQRIGDTNEFEPTQRSINRFNAMDWIDWLDENGGDAFTLLPVKEDYAENIVKDKINIIDWVNLDGSRLFDISKIMEDIKAELGRGIAIVVLQKGDGPAPRGGQFAKDFTDCELLIDRLSERESLLTIGKVKEYTKPVMGRTFAFSIYSGVKIHNFREVVQCPQCWGKKWKKSGNSSVPCDNCFRTGYIDH